MTEQQNPVDRLNYSGDLQPVVAQLCDAYNVGTPTNFSAIAIGYEDCNVVIETNQDKYLAKMFAKIRTPDDIARYATVMQAVVVAGVSHPELITTKDGQLVHNNNGISMVLMKYIDGDTFFGLDRAPDDAERLAIVEQATKINSITIHPPFLSDSWSITNIMAMYDSVKAHLSPDDAVTVEQVIAGYHAIPVDELPIAFVHGDMIKTNIIKGKDGKIYILDFSVANWYPRIQELAVIAANLMHDDKGDLPLKDRCQLVADEYSHFSPLSAVERLHLPAYALAGVAMEFLGASHQLHNQGDKSDETAYWLELGRSGLRNAMA
jgi:Ser/Thr protein kinase RdoA (MazF antagonist)